MKKGLYAMSLTALLLAMTACGGNASAPAETNAGETTAGTQAAAETAGDEADTQAGESAMETAAETEAAVELKYSVDDFFEGVDYDPSEYVTLPEDYKNLDLEYEPEPFEEITEEDIDSELDFYLRIDDVYIPGDKQTVEDGDVVNVTYVMNVDGQEPGTPSKLFVCIGDNKLLFEEDLIGHTVGETFTVNHEFPSDYGRVELRGKPYECEMTINCICEDRLATSEDLDEDLVKYIGDYTSVQDYKDHCKERMEHSQQYMRYGDLKAAFYNKLKEICDLKVADELVEKERTYLETFFKEETSGFADIEDWADSSGYDSFDVMVEDEVKDDLIDEAILKSELSTMSDEEMAAFIEEIGDKYDPDGDYTSYSGQHSYLNTIAVDMTVKSIVNGYFEKYYPGVTLQKMP